MSRELSSWRKIIVGHRDWRILFRTGPDETIVTVYVIGDRADDAVYEEAQWRVRSLPSTDEAAQSLAAVLWRMNEERRDEKRSRRRR